MMQRNTRTGGFAGVVASICPFDPRLSNDFRRRRRGPRSWFVVLAALAALAGVSPTDARAQLRVVTTTPAFADLVTQIGGEHVSVQSIMRGPENAHNVQPKPSHMMKLKRADLLIHTGLDAELWVPLLIKGGRNPKLQPGQPGNVDVSQGIARKQVPGAGGLSRALGDIHAYGNPHYMLDPLNGLIVARTICEALKRSDPDHATEFDSNLERYTQRLRTLSEELTERMRPYRGTPVVTYHRTWPYFLDRFGLVKVAEIEPKPGIAPGPQHLARCVATMKERQAKVIIVESFSSRRDAQSVADRTGGVAIVLAQEVKAVSEVQTYEELFIYNIDTLIAAFRQVGVVAQGDGPSTDPIAGDASSAGR